MEPTCFRSSTQLTHRTVRQTTATWTPLGRFYQSHGMLRPSEDFRQVVGETMLMQHCIPDKRNRDWAILMGLSLGPSAFDFQRITIISSYLLDSLLEGLSSLARRDGKNRILFISHASFRNLPHGSLWRYLYPNGFSTLVIIGRYCWILRCSIALRPESP